MREMNITYLFIAHDLQAVANLCNKVLFLYRGNVVEQISIENLFENNIVQIDHILPYSRTYNDNYLNKTLVYTKENQEKGNRTPYEWFGKTDKWDEYETYINNLTISQKKKDNYLL